MRSVASSCSRRRPGIVVRALFSAIGLACGAACAVAGCERRAPTPDTGAVPTATRDAVPPVAPGPPPPDAGGGWTPEALAKAEALARKVTAEQSPCFYGEVEIRGYPQVYVYNLGGGGEKASPGGAHFVVSGGTESLELAKRLTAALEGPFHQEFPPERFGPRAEKTSFEVRGGAYADGRRLRKALSPCLDGLPQPLRFGFQLDAKGALDPKTVEGPDAKGRACVHRVMPGLVFPCLAKLYVQADVGDVPF